MWTLLTITLVIISGSVSEKCSYWNSVELVNGTYNGLTFAETEYYVDNQTGLERGCVCLKGTCARKCCPPNMAYDADNMQCISYNGTFNPPVVDDYGLVEGFNVTEKFIFMYGKMNCSAENNEGRYAAFPSTDEFNLTKDGTFFIVEFADGRKVTTYRPDKYCVDTFWTEDDGFHNNGLMCFVAAPGNNHYTLSSTCMLVSCFFILLTVAVYAWLPELRNLHGLVLIAYLLSFFVGFLFLATMQILILTEEITPKICLILTFIIYFSLLAAFFWLNVMCYDIWWTFSGKRGHGQSTSPRKRFILYAAYAFSVPTVLTILLTVMEFGDLRIDRLFLPNLRKQGCFLYGTSKLFYFYGPILILCVANIIFFGLTAFKIWKIKQQTTVLRGKESSTHDQDRKDKQRFGLYMKLFAVMGVNWIMEVVSSFYPEANVFWQFPDAYNVLLGPIIFVIFVCKKKTWNMIKTKWSKIRTA